MRKKVLLVSLRFNPAFIQHLIAYAKAVEDLGGAPTLLVDSAYKPFTGSEGRFPSLVSLESALAIKPSHAIFFNPSLKNLEAAKRLRCCGCKIIYLYHEPWSLSWKYLANEGLGATCKAVVAHRFTIPVLKAADHVILASRHGLRTYGASDARFNQNARYIPLLYDDDAPSDVTSHLNDRKYFSFIGNPCRAHGFDKFIKTMKVSFSQDRDIKFLIASRFPLPANALSAQIFKRNNHRIELRCGRPLSNEEINCSYAESICIWNVYRRSTQSGVLPKALMFGVPIVCGQMGSFSEFIAENENGCFVSADDPAAILEAFKRFQNDLADYALRCRRTFRTTFYYKAHLDELAELLR